MNIASKVIQKMAVIHRVWKRQNILLVCFFLLGIALSLPSMSFAIFLCSGVQSSTQCPSIEDYFGPGAEPGFGIHSATAAWDYNSATDINKNFFLSNRREQEDQAWLGFVFDNNLNYLNFLQGTPLGYNAYSDASYLPATGQFIAANNKGQPTGYGVQLRINGTPITVNTDANERVNACRPSLAWVPKTGEARGRILVVYENRVNNRYLTTGGGSKITDGLYECGYHGTDANNGTFAGYVKDNIYSTIRGIIFTWNGTTWVAGTSFPISTTGSTEIHMRPTVASTYQTGDTDGYFYVVWSKFENWKDPISNSNCTGSSFCTPQSSYPVLYSAKVSDSGVVTTEASGGRLGSLSDHQWNARVKFVPNVSDANNKVFLVVWEGIDSQETITSTGERIINEGETKDPKSINPVKKFPTGHMVIKGGRVLIDASDNIRELDRDAFNRSDDGLMGFLISNSTSYPQHNIDSLEVAWNRSYFMTVWGDMRNDVDVRKWTDFNFTPSDTNNVNTATQINPNSNLPELNSDVYGARIKINGIDYYETCVNNNNFSTCYEVIDPDGLAIHTDDYHNPNYPTIDCPSPADTGPTIAFNGTKFGVFWTDYIVSCNQGGSGWLATYQGRQAVDFFYNIKVKDYDTVHGLSDPYTLPYALWDPLQGGISYNVQLYVGECFNPPGGDPCSSAPSDYNWQVEASDWDDYYNSAITTDRTLDNKLPNGLELCNGVVTTNCTATDYGVIKGKLSGDPSSGYKVLNLRIKATRKTAPTNVDYREFKLLAMKKDSVPKSCFISLATI